MIQPPSLDSQGSFPSVQLLKEPEEKFPTEPPEGEQRDRNTEFSRRVDVITGT